MDDLIGNVQDAIADLLSKEICVGTVREEEKMQPYCHLFISQTFIVWN